MLAFEKPHRKSSRSLVTGKTLGRGLGQEMAQEFLAGSDGMIFMKVCEPI